MRRRMVVLTIESILELFKDYIGDGAIPEDGRVVSLLYRPNDKGKLALLVESAEWVPGLEPIQARFDLQRIYTV